MNKVIITLIFITNNLLSISQTNQWAFDKSHSKIQFDIAHMVVSEVSGQFHDYDGTIICENEDFENANIEFVIQVKSIDTDDSKRDEHLLKPDFFDAEKYPTITFKSTSFKKITENNYKLIGELTMHGITKTIQLDAKYGGAVKTPKGVTKAGFKVTGTINRFDYGLKHDSVLDTGGLMIGKEVIITCKLELNKITN